MILFFKKFIFLGLILMIVTGVSYADQLVVRVATLEDYAPFCMMTKGAVIDKKNVLPGDDAAEFKGYCWDVLRESFHAMGYTIQLTVTPWARAMVNVNAGRADILFPTGKNANRLKIFDYSREPTNQANFLVYVNSDSQFEWKGLDGLKGLTIGVKRGFNYGDKWAAASDIIRHKIKTIGQGFKILSAHRIDGFLGYEYNWDYYLKQANLTGLYKKLPAFDSTAEYLVALKSNPQGKRLLNIFDSGKKRLYQTGKLAGLKTKWFGKRPGT